MQRTNRTAVHDEHRRFCRCWGDAPLERTLLGYVLSLAFLVVLVNLPIRGGLLSAPPDTLFSSRGPEPDEMLARITMHDLPEGRNEPRRTPDSGVDTAQDPEIKLTHTTVEATASVQRDGAVLRAEVLPVAASAFSGLPTVNESRKLLRHTFGPPAVDEPPRVRLGSMIVRYPLSALKKAVEGLVIVRFTVETSGRASSVRIMKGLDPACDAEVIQAVENASFFPGRKDGREVPAYSQMTVRFVLADSRSGLAYQ